MPKIDIRQISRNKQVMADSTIDSPLVAHFEDADADFPEFLYDNLPTDRIGLLPITEEE
jgi:hypothetical protein